MSLIFFLAKFCWLVSHIFRLNSQTTSKRFCCLLFLVQSPEDVTNQLTKYRKKKIRKEQLFIKKCYWKDLETQKKRILKFNIEKVNNNKKKNLCVWNCIVVCITLYICKWHLRWFLLLANLRQFFLYPMYSKVFGSRICSKFLVTSLPSRIVWQTCIFYSLKPCCTNQQGLN